MYLFLTLCKHTPLSYVYKQLKGFTKYWRQRDFLNKQKYCSTIMTLL